LFTLSRVCRQIAARIFPLGLIVLLGVTFMMPDHVNAQTNPPLGTAANFAVLGAETVTNTGPSIVNGDLGVSPGSAVTGFPPGIVLLPGMIHAGDAVASQAQTDATAAYLNLLGQGCTSNLSGTDLGGLTLTSGVYCFDEGAALTGTLTLDAQGDATDVFIFRMVSTLTTASGSSVAFINGASACNVWWQVGSSATIGTSTSFAGNILALASISLTTGANVTGRALVQTGAVTMDRNRVDISSCVTLPPTPGLSLTKDDGVSNVTSGDTISYTLNFQNTGNVALDNVTLTDAVPADTSFNPGASTPGWDCTGSPCSINVGTLLPGASGSVVFAVTVNNPSGGISNSATITSGATSATASDTTRVVESGDDDDDDEDTGGGTVPTPAPSFVATTTPLGTGTGDNGNSQSGVSGLPNTGGGPPQPTYWAREPGQ